MFHTVVGVLCESGYKNVGRERLYALRPAAYAALGLDIISGIAFVALGICATQWGFWSPSLQGALIGTGCTYLFFVTLRIGMALKGMKYPNAYLFKYTPPKT